MLNRGMCVPLKFAGYEERQGYYMKITIRKLIVIMTVLIFLGCIFCFVNIFTGNPVSAFIASHKIKDYAAVTYPNLNLELSKARYNFENNAYSCYACSKDSEDTKFYIQYSRGKVRDDYEYEVANHFTTYRRLSKEFNLMVKNILKKGFPHKTTLVIGDLVGDTVLLTPNEPLNLDNMPLELSLTVYMLSDVRNEEVMAALLQELNQLMLDRKIAIDTYTLSLEEPMPEESKPGSGSNLYLDSFPAKYITDDQGSLISEIKKHQLEAVKNNKQ